MKTKILLISFAVLLLMGFTNNKINIHQARVAAISRIVTINQLADDMYSVIKVNGKIIYVKSGNNMATGDVFKPSDKLDFKTTESRAAVISKLKGRFVLTASVGKSNTNLLPAMNNISSRAGALLNMIDLQNQFKDNYLILGKMELEIGEKAFPQDDLNFFYMQYTYNGEEIHKKLLNNGNKLIINKEELFKIDNQPIEVSSNTSMKLWYRTTNEQKSILINEFVPIFPDEEQLKKEIEVLLSQLDDNTTKEKKMGEITAYLSQFYGKPQKDNLESWIDNNFKL